MNWQEPETKRQETTMSKLTKNGKNIIVEMAVSYNYKNDSITLTPHDEDMIGKPFYMTLNYGTDAEKSLRELLTEQGVIKEKDLDTHLPATIKHPETFSKDPYVFNIGETSRGTAQCDSSRDSNVLISGDPGAGKTNVLKSFLKHAEYYDDTWNYSIISPYLTEDFKSFNNSQIIESVHDIDQLNKSLDVIVEDFTNRLAWLNNRDKKFDMYLDDTDNELFTKKLIVIDSIEGVLPSLYTNNPMNIEGKEKYIDVMNKLHFLYKNARKVGYYFVFSTQNPSSISGEIKALMGTRIAMGRMDPSKSSMILGTGDGRRIPKGIGKGYLRIYGQGKFFQAYGN